jgi:peptide chain release factor subunit 1
MAVLDREFLRKLAEWSSNGAPVSSLYLDIDGRRYPRREDYRVRAENLCDQLKQKASELDRAKKRSVLEDVDRFIEFLTALDRGSNRGVVLFSSSGAGLWEEVLVPRPLSDRAVVDEHPYVLPLEALLETYESFCTVIVDREKARVFLSKLGRIHEETDIFDDVPGKHDQGGWSQARYQRHIEEHVGRHLKHVGDVLLQYLKRQNFDHLILAGPEEIVPAFEEGLHDYLKRRVVARTTLPMHAGIEEVLAKSLQVEEELEAEQERRTVERLHAEAAAGRHGVIGLEPVLSALNEGRVDTLVVPFGISRSGVRCPQCGWLAVGGKKCPRCGSRFEEAPDVIEAAVEAALRQSSKVETLDRNVTDEKEIGALLRY